MKKLSINKIKIAKLESYQSIKGGGGPMNIPTNPTNRTIPIHTSVCENDHTNKTEPLSNNQCIM